MIINQQHYPETEAVSVYIAPSLYEELFACAVDPCDPPFDDLGAAQLQFVQGMLTVDDNSTAEMTRDALDYLLYTLLPDMMEMWSGWCTEEGDSLVSSAREFLSLHGVHCPY